MSSFSLFLLCHLLGFLLGHTLWHLSPLSSLQRPGPGIRIHNGAVGNSIRSPAQALSCWASAPILAIRRENESNWCLFHIWKIYWATEVFPENMGPTHTHTHFDTKVHWDDFCGNENCQIWISIESLYMDSVASSNRPLLIIVLLYAFYIKNILKTNIVQWKHTGIHGNSSVPIFQHLGPDGSCHGQIEHVSIAVVLPHHGRYHSTAWRKYDEVDKAMRFQLVKLRVFHKSHHIAMVSTSFHGFCWVSRFSSLVSIDSKLALENYFKQLQLLEDLESLNHAFFLNNK